MLNIWQMVVTVYLISDVCGSDLLAGADYVVFGHKLVLYICKDFRLMQV